MILYAFRYAIRCLVVYTRNLIPQLKYSTTRFICKKRTRVQVKLNMRNFIKSVDSFVHVSDLLPD